MIHPVSPKTKAVRSYRLQNTYAERLKAFGGEQRVRQTQQESVSISHAGRAMLEAVRRRPPAEESITYGNPRVQNRRSVPLRQFKGVTA